MGQDLRTTWRRWRTRPALPLLMLTVLTVGTGAGTAVLAFGYAILLRPLPFPDQHELTVVSSEFPNTQLQLGLSAPEASELAALTTAFRDVGFGFTSAGTVARDDGAIRATLATLSAGALAALAPAPSAGRLFLADEDRPGAPDVALVSDRFWRAELGADPSIVGRILVVSGRSREVVGVLPPRADFVGQPVDIWLPLQFSPDGPYGNRANHAYTVVARLAAGQTLASAQADVDRAVAGWAAATGQFHVPAPRMHPLTVTPLTDVLHRDTGQATVLLVLSVLLVLVIAIVNTATLMVAATDARRAETAVRMALGADRWRLRRLHLTETAMISAVCCAGAIGVALVMGEVLESLAPSSLFNADVTLSLFEIGLIAVVVCAGAGASCAALPPPGMRGPGVAAALGDEGRSGTGSPSRQRLRRVLVGVEVALAAALVAGAALVVESFGRLASVSPGFRSEGVLRAYVNLPGARYANRVDSDAFYDALIAELRARPGVSAVGVMSGLPPSRSANNTSILPDGRALTDLHAGLPPVQYLQFVTPGFLAALDVPLLAGRVFTDADRRGSEPVALLNQRAADVYFPDGDVVGRRIRFFQPGAPWVTVIGVVGDMRQGGLSRPAGTEIFLPLGQADNAGGASMTRDMNVVVRAEGDPLTLAADVRAVARRLDPLAAVSGVETMTTIVGRSVAGPRFLALVLGAFALVALTLSASGVYGVVRHAVGSRTREIGVRRALGASTRSVVSLVLRQAAVLIGAGAGAGAMVAVAASPWLEPFVFEVSTSDPGRPLLAALVLAGVGVAACGAPLVRAVRIDPADALRER